MLKYILLGCLVVFLLISLYIYINRKKYTRERYAFFMTMSLISFGGMVLLHIFTDNSFIKIVLESFNSVFHTEIPLPQTSWSDKLWSILIFAILAAVITSIHKNWDGAKSQEEIDFGTQDLMKSFFMGIPGSKITISVENKGEKRNLEQPYFDSSSSWHTDVSEMLKIISNKYRIDNDNDWYNEEHLFISKFSQQNMVIFSSLDEPSDNDIKSKIEFSKLHIEGEISKFIVAIKNIAKEKHSKTICNIEVEYRYKNELLDSLVDFSEYFDDIKIQYEVNEISYGDKLAIRDIYTQSLGEVHYKDKKEQIGSVEEYLLKWSKTKTNKQISLLGEYGQGKSVLSLKLAYDMIQQGYDRVPIIIELRGKSPRNDQLEDIISSWCRKFHIDPAGIMRLIKEGRILIILEGFDEIDMIGDSNRRLEHFNRLWEFARYEKSKVLITGRPNLFLDNKEMDEYLKAYKSDSNLFYSEAIHIKPFNQEQIENSLRNVDEKIKYEILELLKKKTNESFKDLISRPSTLYQASVIWNDLDKENINSASVIENFLNHAYKRQEEKLRTIGRSGVETLLTTNERKYFMIGIALGMVQKNSYTNQINANDLEKLIQKLYLNIPEKVSFDHSLNIPLKKRMKDNQQVLESIFNDIRTSTILVRDFTKNDSFKFSHKSFLEYLNAKYFIEFRFKDTKSKYLDEHYKVYIDGIEKVYNLKGGFNFSDETIGFIVDMIKVEDAINIDCIDILKFISPFSQFLNKYFYLIGVLLLSSFVLLLYFFPIIKLTVFEEINIAIEIVPYFFILVYFFLFVNILLFKKIEVYLEIYDVICNVLSKKHEFSNIDIRILTYYKRSKRLYNKFRSLRFVEILEKKI